MALFGYAVMACASRPAAPVPLVVTVPEVVASPPGIEPLAPVEPPVVQREMGATAPLSSAVPPYLRPLPPVSSLAPANLVPSSLAGSLSNGLHFDLVVRVELLVRGKPAGLHAAGECSVNYDLWDGVYRVQLLGGPRAATNIDAVVRMCTDRQAYADALAATPGAIARQRIVSVKP
jgi:hypothetical protein